MTQPAAYCLYRVEADRWSASFYTCEGKVIRVSPVLKKNLLGLRELDAVKHCTSKGWKVVLCDAPIAKLPLTR